MRANTGAPRELAAQAQAAVDVARAARRYFDEPSEANAVFVRKARLESRRRRVEADAALEKAAPSGDWLAVSAALAELADEACWAVEEAQRFGAALGAAGRRLAEAQETAARKLAGALAGSEDAAAAIVEAKNKALQIEDIRRRARGEALEQPRLAAELSAQAVLDRFSRAAEAVQRAADVLAGRLGERA